MKYKYGWYMPDTELHFEQYFQKSSNANGVYEYQKFQREQSFTHLENRRVALDIGANIGLWAKDMCSIFDKVILFEPYDPNIECLKKNLVNHYNFEVYSTALSNFNGKADMHIYEEGLGHNTLNPKADSQPNKKIQIEVIKLDDLKLMEIDYIKIDVQFHELEVIQGAIETLKNNKPVLCIESARRNVEELNYVKKFIHILDKLNYKIIGEAGKELFLKK